MRAPAIARGWLAIGLAALTACTGGSFGAPCIRNSDCIAPLACGFDSICAMPPDAPPGDGGIDGSTTIPDLPDAAEDADPPDAAPADAPDDAAVDAGIDA